MEKPWNLKRPAKMAGYVIRVMADKTYLIYDTKADTIRCTRCGKTGKLSRELTYGLSHNVECHCPFCGEKAIAKSNRYGRKNLTEYGRILWLKKAGRVTFAQLDEYELDYTGEKPEVSFWPAAQYRFASDRQEYYKHHPGWYWCDEYWEKMKTVKLPRPPSTINFYSTPRYEKTVVYYPSLEKVGTDLKYADLNLQRFNFDMNSRAYGLIGYIYNFLKYPSIEILDKAGFWDIVAEKVLGTTCRWINWQSKDLRKILKMNRQEIRDFRDTQAGIGTLEKYHQIKRKGINVRFDQLRYFSYAWEGEVDRIRVFTDTERTLTYLKGQGDTDLRIYADYLEECQKLGEDMTDKKVLRPANLQTAHENTSSRLRIEKDRKTKEVFEKGKTAIYDNKPYSFGKFFIRRAESIDELNKESQDLHHCVRTYVNKVARGTCVILFIRRVECPDKPFFTLELNQELKIVQCRGEHNCSYPEEVKSFIEQWEKDILQKLRKKKGAAAPAA